MSPEAGIEPTRRSRNRRRMRTSSGIVGGVTSSGGCGWSNQLRGVWVELPAPGGVGGGDQPPEEPDEERGAR